MKLTQRTSKHRTQFMNHTHCYPMRDLRSKNWQHSDRLNLYDNHAVEIEFFHYVYLYFFFKYIYQTMVVLFENK